MNKLGHRPSELAHDEPLMCDIVKSTPPPKKKKKKKKISEYEYILIIVSS